jgi:hypothetical protein
MMRSILLGSLFFLLFFSATVVTGQYTVIKAILLFCLLVALSPRGINISVISTFGLILVSVVGFFAAFQGLSQWRTVGVIDEARNYLIWPIFIWVIFSLKYRERDIRVILQVFDFFILFFPVLVIALVGAYALLGFKSFFLPGGDGVLFFGVGVDDGRVDLAFLGMNFFMFATYLHTARIFTTGKYRDPLHVAVGLLYALLVIISGRRAFLLGYIALVVILIFYNSRGLTSGLRIGVGVFPGLILGYTLFELDVYAIIEDVTDAFAMSSVAGFERWAQHEALLEMFYQSPLVGHGFGSFSHEVVRNLTKEWAYELSFHKILVNSGLLGFFVYGLVLSFFLVAGVRRFPQLRPFVFALLIYVVGALSNPYLANVDMLWIFGVLLWASFRSNSDSAKAVG